MKKTLSLLFFLILISAFTVEMVKADEDRWTVSADLDDVSLRWSDNNWYPLGWVYTGDSSAIYYDFDTGVRFQTVGVPQGSTITSAYLQFTAGGRVGSIYPTVIISGENIADSSTFSTIADFKARNRTVTSVNFSPTVWTGNVEYNMSNMMSVVQEIVNAGDWVANNSMTFFVSHKVGWNGTQGFIYSNAFDMDDAKAPKLFIVWEAPPEYPTPNNPVDLFGAGFNDSAPYVKLHWTHDLNNTDFFEVQNSTNKASWDTLGYSTITEYLDFEVENGTDRFYRVRACVDQPDGWYNSSFTDINFETVYFLNETINGGGDPDCPPCNETHVLDGAWKYPITSSVSVVEGTYVSGTRDSLDFVDNDLYQVTESVGAPAIDIRFNFTKINTTDININLEMLYNHTGSHEHLMSIQAFNFTTNVWLEVGICKHKLDFHWHNVSMSFFLHNDLIEDGQVWMRVLISSPGNVNHDVFIDYLRLKAFVMVGENLDAWSISWLTSFLWLGLVAIGVFKSNKILIMFAGFFGLILGLLLMTTSSMVSIALILLNLYLIYEGTG